MRIKRILSLFALAVIILVLFFVRSSSSIDCTLYGGYCQEPGGSINVEHWYNPHENALGYTVCNHFLGTHTWTCDKDPDDAHCDSTGFYYWLSSDDCVDENSQTSQSAGCCGSSGSPSPPSPPSCTPHCLEEGYTHYEDPPSISTSVASITTYQYSDCGEAEKCYRCNAGCGACNPNVGEYDSPQPANTYTVSTCTYTNTSCSTSSKYCFHECPEPTCKYLYSQTGIDTWVDGGCPTGDENCVEVTMPVNVPIPNGNDIFPAYPAPLKSGESYIDYTCTQEEILTCYLPNINPNVFSIDAERINPEDYKFAYQWDRFSGKDFNNPVRVTASYEDGDGSDDIIALYVWWSDESSIKGKGYTTPTEVYQGSSLNGQAYNEHNFGFMISRSYDSNNWDNADVYIPDRNADPDTWVKIGNVNSPTLAIDNSNNSTNPLEDDFVLITDIDITPISSQKRVDLSLNMYFVNDKDNSPISAYVETRDYNLWGSVNDRIGYLPFNVPYYQNNYPETAYHILDSGNDAWEDKGNDWHVDIINPEAEIKGKVLDSHAQQVTVNVEASDTQGEIPSGLSYVRLDVCKSGEDAIAPLSYYDSVENQWIDYMPKDCALIGGEYIPDSMIDGISLLGKSGGYPDNPLNDVSFTGSAVVGLGENDEGSLTFYLTVMDMAGNTNLDDQQNIIYRIEQWAIVEDALVFGKKSAISMTKDLEEPVTTVLSQSEVLQRLRDLDKYDFTNQALLGGYDSNLNYGLDRLRASSANNSFKSTDYAGLQIHSLYGELVEQYEIKRNLLVNPVWIMYDVNGDGHTGNSIGYNCGFTDETCFFRDGIPSPFVELTELDISDQSSIDSSILNGCGFSPLTKYCILRTDNPLTIESGFKFDRNVLILANNSVTIEPDIVVDTTANPEYALIIVAHGNITISSSLEAADMDPEVDGYDNYDVIEAFLLAEGYIEIEKDSTQNPPNDRGLFVEGGLVGFTQEDQTNSSVVNRREIYYANMGRYPVLVVQGNSKYGMLSKQLFGSQIDIYQSLQGFKP